MYNWIRRSCFVHPACGDDGQRLGDQAISGSNLPAPQVGNQQGAGTSQDNLAGCRPDLIAIASILSGLVPGLVGKGDKLGSFNQDMICRRCNSKADVTHSEISDWA
jgi:hypothetical protein